METIFLKKGEDRRLRVGHLWVFSNEVDVKRSPLTAFAPGQPVQVADAGGRHGGQRVLHALLTLEHHAVVGLDDLALDGL